MINGIYLLLGGNIGDRWKSIHGARKLIAIEVGEIIEKSGIYETDAWGNENQRAFLNQVIQIETELEPLSLLIKLHDIETKLGRKRQEHWGARTIDIDILYYNDLVLDHPKLKIPHPEIASRKFTLVPLVELAPKFKNPKLLKTSIELLKECEDELEVKLVEEVFLSSK